MQPLLHHCSGPALLALLCTGGVPQCPPSPDTLWGTPSSSSCPQGSHPSGDMANTTLTPEARKGATEVAPASRSQLSFIGASSVSPPTPSLPCQGDRLPPRLESIWQWCLSFQEVSQGRIRPWLPAPLLSHGSLQQGHAGSCPCLEHPLPPRRRLLLELPPCPRWEPRRGLRLWAPYLLYLFLIAGEAGRNCRLCCASSRRGEGSQRLPPVLERVETVAGPGRMAVPVKDPLAPLLGHTAVLAAAPRLRRPAPSPAWGLPAQGAHPRLGNGLPEEETLLLRV